MNKYEVYMAPMQGVTEAPFRNLFEQYFGGIDAYYTPFIRWEHGGVRRKDLRDISPDRNSVCKLVPQLLAGTADEAESILQYIIDCGYREVDINMGCAYPVLAKKGKGSGILAHPEQVADLLQVVHRHPQVKFSAKMRLGYNNAQEGLDLLPLLNKTPLTRIVIHARTGIQQYKGACDREAFTRFAAGCNHPLLYNGEMLDEKQWKQMCNLSSRIVGVMWGRGLLAAPWRASEFRDGRIWTLEDKRVALRGFHEDLFAWYRENMEGGDRQILTKMKAIWEYLLPGAERKLRKKIHKAQRFADYIPAVQALIQTFEPSMEQLSPVVDEDEF